MTTAEDIDALLAAPKTLAGGLTWRANDAGTVATLKAPVARDGLLSSLQLEATVTLRTDPQTGRVVLLFERRPIQRLSIWPTHPHPNPMAATVPMTLRGLRFDAGLSRAHLWRDNRRWPRPVGDNVNVASPLAMEPQSLGEGFTLFLALCGIDADLPQPPWTPRLPL